jgi:hypothetical protein
MELVEAFSESDSTYSASRLTCLWTVISSTDKAHADVIEVCIREVPPRPPKYFGNLACPNCFDRARIKKQVANAPVELRT